MWENLSSRYFYKLLNLGGENRVEVIGIFWNNNKFLTKSELSIEFWE